MLLSQLKKVFQQKFCMHFLYLPCKLKPSDLTLILQNPNIRHNSELGSSTSLHIILALQSLFKL
jgi:hypothetical protein